jgi:hypothetical protein
MKIKEILENNVIYTDRFAKKEEPKYSSSEYDSDVAADMQRMMVEPDSPENVKGELNKKRYEKMLNTRSGEHVSNADLVSYVQGLVNPSSKEEKNGFNEFISSLLLGDKHLYEIVTQLNKMLSSTNASKRVVGVSQDAEDWYFM